MFRLLWLSACIAMLIAACKQNGDKIVNEEDYRSFISDTSQVKKLTETDTEISFWRHRLQLNKDDLAAKMKLASLLSARFDLSGNITELHSADSLYRVINQVNRFSSSATYRSLAYLSVKQHEFRRAKTYLDSALAMGDDRYQTLLSLFDVQMELGQTISAEKTLNSLADKNNFQFLVRQAKLEDSKGDISKAIAIMEKAAAKVNADTETFLYLWANSNLADMYGHANRFEDSYRTYLKVLQKDPGYYHCLKGIAWLAFSHDRNTSEAKRILLYLKQKHPVPDYDLLLAEIAAYEGRSNDQQQYTSLFINVVTTPAYGNMYNKYVCDLEAAIQGNNDAALKIAETEVSNRPTNGSFALLAWTYCHSNNIQRSLDIIRRHLKDKNLEPDAMYKIGMIYHVAGDKTNARTYLEKAYESAYELGPLISSQIEQVLKTI
jgi:tetratricopeptide (TPR) repeat protein